ncbi:MAG: tyrosine recombinase XerC [Eubacteriales bacterium]|nr:tyrosine recombinase XerC [Eubacteriales bacterium]
MASKPHDPKNDSFIWLEQYFAYMQAIKERSVLTMKEYRYDLVMFFRFMVLRRSKSQAHVPFEETSIAKVDEQFIRDISLSDLYAFISFLSIERKNGPSIRARRVSAIKSFFNYLKNKARILEENVALELESPKLLRRLPRHLSLEESEKLLDVAAESQGQWSARDYCILTLFLNCGMRLSELCGIDLKHIRGDTLIVLGKGGKERTIYLNSACLESLEAYQAVRPSHLKRDFDALFISRKNQRISAKMVQVLIKKYIAAAGLDTRTYSTHKLRHTAATLMYKYGKVDIRALQAILGHKSIATTEIYTHIDADSLHQAVESNPLSRVRRKSTM